MGHTCVLRCDTADRDDSIDGMKNITVGESDHGAKMYAIEGHKVCFNWWLDGHVPVFAGSKNGRSGEPELLNEAVQWALTSVIDKWDKHTHVYHYAGPRDTTEELQAIITHIIWSDNEYLYPRTQRRKCRIWCTRYSQLCTKRFK